MLVAIITRYPGIRSLFYHPKDCEQALPTFKERWTWEHQDCGEEWDFYLKYTLHCLSDSDLTALMENELPSELGRLELQEDDGPWTLIKIPIKKLLSICRSILIFTHGCTRIYKLPDTFQAQSRNVTHTPN